MDKVKSAIHKISPKFDKDKFDKDQVEKKTTSTTTPTTTTSTTSDMSLPKTYKAVVLDGPNAPWTIKDVELKQPSEGEVLIKVHACGVCFSDAATQLGYMGPLAKFPLIPGHEIIGTVVETGPGVTKWKKGDKVGGPWHGGHDGTCTQCAKGRNQLCDNQVINGVSRDGGYAEYCNLRSEAVVRIPDDADPAAYAPILCAGVTLFNSIRNMGILAGETVAIQGLGGLGHLGIQYARKMGYRTVALSSGGAKKDLAFKLGATDYVDGSKEDTAEALNKMGGAKLVIVTAPNPEVMGPLLNGVAKGGKLLILAPVGDVPVNTVTMIMKNISVHGWPSGQAQDSEDAIAFTKLQDINCHIEKFPLSKVEEAVNHMTSGKVRFRAVLTMD